MRKKFSLVVEIPEGVESEYISESSILKCKKGDVEIERKILIQGTDVKVDDGKIQLVCQKANKKDIAIIMTGAAHVRNMFKGFEEKFVYEMEVCNVHFPMTVKVEGNKVNIGNFLGEKIGRSAKVLKGVEVEVEGQSVTVSGHDLEKAGQTAANIEKATKVPKKDRRIFQDGIFITSKPGRPI
jgi:large subunit ribosomal protein L6